MSWSTLGMSRSFVGSSSTTSSGVVPPEDCGQGDAEPFAPGQGADGSVDRRAAEQQARQSVAKLHRRHVRGGLADRVPDRGVVVEDDALGQMADAGGRCGQGRLHQGRLAYAVGPDEPDSLGALHHVMAPVGAG